MEQLLFDEGTTAMDRTPNRQKGDYNDRRASPHPTEAQYRPQQEWHKSIKQGWRAAPCKSSKADVADNRQPREQCDRLQMVDQWFSQPCIPVVDPTQNGRSQSEEC